MIVVKLIDSNSLSISFNYCEDYIQRIKQVPFSYFDSNSKTWIIDKSYFNDLEKIFKGELVFKTPRWVILNEEKPDYSSMYQLTSSIKIPKLNAKLFDYQEFGVKFMIDRLIKNNFVFNTDAVGLGKSIEAIACFKYFIENHNHNRILIVVKKSLKQQWLNEINKFTDLNKDFYINYSSSKKAERYKLYNELKNKEKFILITNYHSVMKDFDILKDFNFNMLIADEVHYIKAINGEMNKSMRKISETIDKTIFLTGTPLMSKPDDLFGIIQIADKKYLGSWNKFKERYIKTQFCGNYVKVVGYKHLDELRDKIQNVIIRRTENEVSLDLPDVITKEIFVDKDSIQKKLDEAIKESKKKLLLELSEIESKKNDIKYQKLYEQKEGMIKGLVATEQASADDPRLINLSKSNIIKKFFSQYIPDNYKRSPKMEMLLEIVEEILDSNQKVLIFTKFERCTRLIQDELNKINIKSVLYTGDINDEQRIININLFNTTEDFNVFIATDAGSDGLNLQVANHQINFDLPDTLAIKTQRMGRIRRANSKFKTAYVYDLITINSKDQDRLENIKNISNLFDTLITSDEAQSEALINAAKNK